MVAELPEPAFGCEPEDTGRAVRRASVISAMPRVPRGLATNSDAGENSSDVASGDDEYERRDDDDAVDGEVHQDREGSNREAANSAGRRRSTIGVRTVVSSSSSAGGRRPIGGTLTEAPSGRPGAVSAQAGGTTCATRSQEEWIDGVPAGLPCRGDGERSGGGGKDDQSPIWNSKDPKLHTYLRKIELWCAYTRTPAHKRGIRFLASLEGDAFDTMELVTPTR